MKRVLLSELRDRNTDTARFRVVSDQLARLLCAETVEKLESEEVIVETPVGAVQGVEISDDIMVVPILRAALALLPAFMEAIPNVSVGVVGLERDEETAEARAYYQKLPEFLPSKAIIIDPMLATGGSACMAVEFLIEAGYSSENIYFSGVIAAQEGLDRLAQVIPEENITMIAVDPMLNDQKYIVPGLGDYGDRYFGT